MSTAYRAFRALPAPVRGAAEQVLRRTSEREVSRSLPSWGEAGTRLLVAPLNTAGQGWRWARAAEESLPGVRAISVRAQPRAGATPMAHAADLELTPAMQVRGLAPYRDLVLSATHVLAESGRAVLDDVHHRSLLDDLPALRDAGLSAAVVLHGSEVRDLREHARRYPASPFAGEWDERWERMQRRVEETSELLERLRDEAVPLLVSTPDLLEHVPDARWLPVVVDVAAFACARPPLQGEVPVVLHAPSNPRLKGTAAVDAVLGELAAAGRLTYRRLDGVRHDQMPDALAAADVVIDQVVLGNPGVLLTEAMAAGRVVVTHLSDGVRTAMRDADPAGEPPPVIDADPESLRAAVERILDDRDSVAALAAHGPAWAARNHDGRRAAQVLRDCLLD